MIMVEQLAMENDYFYFRMSNALPANKS